MVGRKKVLLIKLGAIGDVMHTSVVASAIKEQYPDYEVHFLTIKMIVPLLENHPHIDKVIVWDEAKRKSFRYLLEVASTLRKERYDIVFNFTRALRNNMLSFLAFPKRVVGKRSFKGKSWVEEYFQTAKLLFSDLRLPERLYMGTDKACDDKVEREVLHSCPRPYIVVSPAGAANKNRQGRVWGLDNWNLLIEKLSSYGGTVFVIGSNVEQEIHKSINNAVICSGKLSLLETSSLLAKADLVISGDSGPIHIASAYDVKTLALLGSTSPDKIKPYGKNGYFASTVSSCKYCWAKKCKMVEDKLAITPCMAGITPELVLETIKNNGLL